METVIVGVDCATNPKNVGLAKGVVTDLSCTIVKIESGNSMIEVIDCIVDWIAEDQPTLLAFDAPLGWPIGLSQALSDHNAGMPIMSEANIMFRRLTDITVWEMTGKIPLDVGADRIARTAHAALQLLGDLRRRIKKEILLAWKIPLTSEPWAIEVYPAGTLAAYGIRTSGYKRQGDWEARRDLIEFLQEHLALTDDPSFLETNHHAIDAVLCILSGWDFLRGNVVYPDNIHIAKKEGWIWTSKKQYF